MSASPEQFSITPSRIDPMSAFDVYQSTRVAAAVDYPEARRIVSALEGERTMPTTDFTPQVSFTHGVPVLLWPNGDTSLMPSKTVANLLAHAWYLLESCSDLLVVADRSHDDPLRKAVIEKASVNVKLAGGQ